MLMGRRPFPTANIQRPIRISAPPVAVGITRETTRGPATVRIPFDSGSLVLATSTAGTFPTIANANYATSNTLTQRYATLQLNPVLTANVGASAATPGQTNPFGPQVSNICRNFSKFRFENLVWEYEPIVGSNTAGQIVLASESDPVITGSYAAATSYQFVTDCSNSKSFPVWERTVGRVPNPPPNNWYNVTVALESGAQPSIDSASLRQSSQGVVITSGIGLEATTTYGVLRFHGVLVLRDIVSDVTASVDPPSQLPADDSNIQGAPTMSINQVTYNANASHAFGPDVTDLSILNPLPGVSVHTASSGVDVSNFQFTAPGIYEIRGSWSNITGTLTSASDSDRADTGDFFSAFISQQGSSTPPADLLATIAITTDSSPSPTGFTKVTIISPTGMTSGQAHFTVTYAPGSSPSSAAIAYRVSNRLPTADAAVEVTDLSQSSVLARAISKLASRQ
jgi:hypothetical protein